jgi:hypothetical protein
MKNIIIIGNASELTLGPLGIGIEINTKGEVRPWGC